MIAPGMYSIESYEPAVLKPEEVKQNEWSIRRAYTEKKQLIPNYKFNLANIPVMNPQFINNTKPPNNGFINNKIVHNKNMTTIPISVSMKNPFNYNAPIVNERPNKVMNTIQFNNPFLSNKKNKQIKYVYRAPVQNNPFIYQNRNNPQQIKIQRNPQHIYRSKSPQFIQNFIQFHAVNNNNNIIRNKYVMPVYRKILYRKKY